MGTLVAVTVAGRAGLVAEPGPAIRLARCECGVRVGSPRELPVRLNLTGSVAFRGLSGS